MFCLWSLASGKCLCVSGKVVLWLICFYVRILAPISYLKLWNCRYVYIYICIVRRSRVSVPSSSASSSSVRPSVRPIVGPVVVVSPLSVRSVVSRRRRRRPLCVPPLRRVVRPVVRPVVVVRALSVRPRPSRHRRPSSVCPSRRPSNYYLRDVA